MKYSHLWAIVDVAMVYCQRCGAASPAREVAVLPFLEMPSLERTTVRFDANAPVDDVVICAECACDDAVDGFDDTPVEGQSDGDEAPALPGGGA